MAVSQVLTVWLNVASTPIQAVAQAIIVLTPGSVAETLIGIVGRKDKPLLVTGVTIAVLLLGALAGVLCRRSRWAGNAVVLAVTGLGAAAVVTGEGAAAVDLLPVVVGGLVWYAAQGWLVGYLEPRAAAAGPTASGPDRPATPVVPAEEGATRRGFLLRAGTIALAGAVVGLGSTFLGRSRQAVEASRKMLRLPATGGLVPKGAQVDVPGMPPWQTPDDTFYRIDTALVVPSIDPQQWRLRIHGMVDHPIELSYHDLLQRQITQAWVTICCVSNPVGGSLIGNAWWSGVRVADLLQEAGVRPGAAAVRQTSQDGWTCGTPIQALTDGRNAMLAVAMNGQPLPIEHGFPVRMIVPGLYGYVSATKWITDLEVTTFDRFAAYWTVRGWSATGPVKTESRVDVPRSGASVKAGAVRVGGSAWAQHTGIATVEYRLDGQPWQTAELGTVPDVDTWVQWAGTVQAPPGDHTVTVRATDRSGYAQTAVPRGVVPDGATGWDSVSFTAS
ncbi:MAG TPA: molybdopterin-dependent oxidoreductase [Nocardioidaceae bacterium]|nr:molybdopterin-dependent oxidoreductase [Nocardioidaceae bacterium]